MNRAGIAWIGVLTAFLGLALGGPAQAVDDETMQEVLQILRDEGLIDEERHSELATKVEKRGDKLAWLERISIWGDFRGRYENFFFDRDPVAEAAGERLPNRHRVRYRLRLNLSGVVNDYATVFLRLASGSDDARSTNQTLGRGVDFDSDDIRLDLAYVTLTATPGGELCCVEDGYLGLDLGKVKNPFVWKDLGMDALVWDGDITPEGGSLRFRGRAGPVNLFANGGFYLIDENGADSAKDPQLLGGQLGGDVELFENVTFGARGSIYHYASLDDDFFTRAAGGGNLVDGLARRNGSIQVIESSAFLELAHHELFPILIFGSYAHNLSARTSLASGAGRNDDAYALGIFVGDKKKLVKVGFAYVAVQANALPSMFIDSDLTDGVTNRDAYVWMLQRQLLSNLELAYKVLLSDKLRGGAAYVDSIAGADRLRMQLDLKLKF